jgi:hypothetical protein
MSVNQKRIFHEDEGESLCNFMQFIGIAGGLNVAMMMVVDWFICDEFAGNFMF